MKAESTRVVVDTNVWISAALSLAGAPARVVRQVLAHAVPVLSEPTFAELQRRLWLPKFDRYVSIEQRQQILHDLSAAAYWTEVPPEIASRTYCRDADDDKFIHAALATEAAWLVTGDRDLLAVLPIPPLQILSPADALNHPDFPGQGQT
jgi:putative PIN family toxin of toxin-antitoxin system